MAFKVAARMILELGAELISSDSVALYELVKNSVDAGSQWVSITIQVVLKRSYFLEAIEAIEEGESLSVTRKKLLSNIEPGAPATAAQRFRELILEARDHPKDIQTSITRSVPK